MILRKAGLASVAVLRKRFAEIVALRTRIVTGKPLANESRFVNWTCRRIIGRGVLSAEASNTASVPRNYWLAARKKDQKSTGKFRSASCVVIRVRVACIGIANVDVCGTSAGLAGRSGRELREN